MKKVFITLATLGSLHGVAQQTNATYFSETSMFRHQNNPALLQEGYASVLVGNINLNVGNSTPLSTFLYPNQTNSGYELTTFLSSQVDSKAFLNKVKNGFYSDINYQHNIFSVGFESFGGVNLIEWNVKGNSHLYLARDFFAMLKSDELQTVYDLSGSGLDLNLYSEVVAGHSRRVSDELTLGVKVKGLLGAGYANIEAKRLSVLVSDDKWALNTDVVYSISGGKSTFGYDPNNNPNDPKGKKLGDGVVKLRNFDMPGWGLATDFGAVYEPSFAEDLTLSASLIDVGFMKWQDTNIAASRGEWEFDGFNGFELNKSEGKSVGKQLEEAGENLLKVLAPYEQEQTTSTKFLTATANMAAEYKMPFYNRLKVGALYTLRFHKIQPYKSLMLAANVRPYDWIEISANVSHTTLGWSTGGFISFYTPYFNTYLGSTNMYFDPMVLRISSSNQRRINLVMGITFPFGKEGNSRR